MKLKISKGFRKYLRKEKARIRREVFDIEEQKRLIKELYKNIEQTKPEKNLNKKESERI